MTQPHLPRRTPFAFGLTFVPPGALGGLVTGTSEPAQSVLRACQELRAAFAFVPSWEPWAEQTLDVLVSAGVSAFWAVQGPLWPVLRARGIVEGLRETLTDPSGMLQRIESGLDAVVARARHGLESGAAGIVLAEDLAGTEGPLVAPDFAIEQLLPAYTAVVRVTSEFSSPAILHSDGDTRWLLGAVKRAGFTAVHAGGGLDFDGFERLFWAARANDLAVIGGLQSTALSNGRAQAEVLGSRAGLLARAGGLLLGDDGGITEPQQIALLAEALVAARTI
ncbi:MAG: hypothetical protein D9V44_03815 [Actinobacteria bacterium]|nr:MAG: hypothetical protein D9V44_03815 [Actinomycetota bacterium]